MRLSWPARPSFSIFRRATATAETYAIQAGRLIVGSNRNDILARFLASNDMSMQPVEPSLSPSMDIQVSSNFERLLFELLERDAVATAEAMTGFRSSGRMAVSSSTESYRTVVAPAGCGSERPRSRTTTPPTGC